MGYKKLGRGDMKKRNYNAKKIEPSDNKWLLT